jgi:kynureninase
VNSAGELDARDPLAPLRDAFQLPADMVYLDGNSLGALPRSVPPAVDRALREQWGADLIASWNRHRWIDLPRHVGERIAPLIGAGPGQVLCVDSISVNLFKLLASALALRPGRPVILTLRDDFPTDGYMVQGLAGLLGEDRCEQRAVAPEELPQALDSSVAALLVTEVSYRTGERFPMHRWTAAAQAAGALAIWDLAHSAGAMPVHLDACDVDFAVGCGYKYFNGGPGAPAFVYANRRWHGQLQQPLSGWLGHADPFAFDSHYQPAPGVQRFQAGTPPIISMVALDAALDVFDGVSVAALRDKSLALADFFLECLAAESGVEDLRCVTPPDPERRGSQVSLAHPDAWGISQALIEAGVVVDFRGPDIVRLGFAPLYNRFADAEQAASTLGRVMREARYRDPRFQQRPKVT